MNKIAYFLIHGMILAYQQWSFQIMRTILYGTIVAMWAYTWSMAPTSMWEKLGISWSHMVWYVVIAEIAAFAGPNSHRHIEADLREGRFQTHFARPMPWLHAYYAQEWGFVPFSLMTIGMAGIGIGLFATHVLPFDAPNAMATLVHIIFASFIWLNLLTCVGLTTLWMGSPQLAYWMLQKAGFILGGLLLPLTLYPGWLQTIAWATPFPAVFYIPAQSVLPGRHFDFITSISIQIVTLILTSLLTIWLYSRFERKILNEG